MRVLRFVKPISFYCIIFFLSFIGEEKGFTKFKTIMRNESNKKSVFLHFFYWCQPFFLSLN